MANYANLLATIAANIYTNHNNEVTAAMVKTAVDTMVASLGAGYQFMGVASPTTDPGTPDEQVFYIATTPGTYTKFGGITLNLGEVSILKGSGSSWSKEITGASVIKSLGYLGNGDSFGVDSLQNGIVNFVSPGTPAGVPSELKYGGGCILVTMRERSSQLMAFDTQFLITPDGWAVRSYSGSAWNSWGLIQHIKSIGYVAGGASINVDSLKNGIINFVSPGTPAGLPSELRYGGGAVLITLRESDSSLTSFDTQFIINGSGIANRSYASGWNAWNVITFPRTFECGVGKAYTTIRAAVAAATAIKGAQVLVYPGTYDFTTEFADVFLAQSGTGVVLYNDVHVKFLPGAYVTCDVDPSDTWAYFNFEPFHIAGNFTLENAHIVAKNTRYCVHDEFGGSGTYHGRYINCHMEYTNEQSDAHFVQCIGGGLGEHGYIEIIGGYYKSYTLYGLGTLTPDESQWPISYHNGYNANADSHIIIRDVYLADKGYLRFGNYGPSVILTPVQVSGCRMYKPVWLMDETSDPTQPTNFEIISFANEIVNP